MNYIAKLHLLFFAIGTWVTSCLFLFIGIVGPTDQPDKLCTFYILFIGALGLMGKLFRDLCKEGEKLNGQDCKV